MFFWGFCLLILCKLLNALAMLVEYGDDIQKSQLAFKR